MNYRINISPGTPRRVYSILLAAGFLIIAAFIFLSIVIRKPAQTFNLDSEANIPAWFASAQYLLLGFIMLSGNMHRNLRENTGKFIKLAAMGFIFMSMDEAAGLHEALGNILEKAEWNPLTRGRSGSWALIYAAFAGALLIWGRKAVYELYVSYRSEARVAIAGIVLLACGAFVFEMVGSVLPRNSELDLLYKVEVILEEYFEMLGVSTIIYGTLKILLKQQEAETQNLRDEIIADYKIISGNKKTVNG